MASSNYTGLIFYVFAFFSPLFFHYFFIIFNF